MQNSVYSKPSIEKIASFKDATNGLWTGKFRDLFGGRALFLILY